MSVVDKKFSKPPKQVEAIIYKEVDSDDESSKPLGNVIIKEWNKKSPDKITSLKNSNALKNNIMAWDIKINNFKIN